MINVQTQKHTKTIRYDTKIFDVRRTDDE